jgi:hypothetical protein
MVNMSDTCVIGDSKKRLSQLDMEINWIYEVAISILANGKPHVAPFGIRTENHESIVMKIYIGSNTLKNILKRKEFAVNLLDDPNEIYRALFERESIEFIPAKQISAPFLHDAPAIIEAKLIKAVDKSDSYILEAEVIYVHIHRKSELINRAKNLLLESLILSTRIEHISELRFRQAITENYRVIRKVAPGSKYEYAMEKLIEMHTF